MKTINNYILVLISFVVVACYPKEDISAELGEPKHVVEYKDNPIDSYIYNLYVSTGVFLLYEFDDMDYKWNMGSTALSSYNLNRQTDRTVLTDGIKYLDKVLMDYYSDDFKKKYFPLNLFLCDSIRKGAIVESLPVLVGRNYMAIGQINGLLKEMTATELNVNKGIINGEMWGNIIYTNNLINIPDDFFAPGDEYYGNKIGSNTDSPPFDAKKFGFWNMDPGLSTSYAFMAPKRNVDVAQFVQTITSHSYEEIMQMMQGYPILYNKYIILTNYLKSEYGLDLQAIGEIKPTIITN